MSINNPVVKTVNLRNITLAPVNMARSSKWEFNPKDVEHGQRANKDWSLILSLATFGYLKSREPLLACMKPEGQDVIGIPVYQGTDVKITKAGEKYVIPAQELERMGKLQQPKKDATIMLFGGNRRWYALAWANVLRVLWGKEPITEVTVCDYGTITEEEMIKLCLEENTRKSEGLLPLDTKEQIRAGKRVYALSRGNMTCAEFERTCGMKHGQAQVMYELVRLDYKYPWGSIIERTCEDDIPWLTQKGKDTYKKLADTPLIMTPPPEGADDATIFAHNAEIVEQGIVTQLKAAGRTILDAVNAKKTAARPQIEKIVDNPTYPEIVRFALRCHLKNDLGALIPLCGIQTLIDPAVQSILDSFKMSLSIKPTEVTE